MLRCYLAKESRLEYRIEDQELFDIDYGVFVHLYASLTSRPLSKLAAELSVLVEFKI